MKAMETENLENENLTRTGDAVKLSRLDGKLHLCLKGMEPIRP